MQIQKRSMNWLPKLSMYQEMQANKAKRADANARVDANMAQASAMIGIGPAASEEAYNLTLRMAAARVQAGVNVKPRG
jgi:hypothetical protein